MRGDFRQPIHPFNIENSCSNCVCWGRLQEVVLLLWRSETVWNESGALVISLKVWFNLTDVLNKLKMRLSSRVFLNWSNTDLFLKRLFFLFVYVPPHPLEIIGELLVPGWSLSFTLIFWHLMNFIRILWWVTIQSYTFVGRDKKRWIFCLPKRFPFPLLFCCCVYFSFIAAWNMKLLHSSCSVTAARILTSVPNFCTSFQELLVFFLSKRIMWPKTRNP